jgi:hypothetical protein
MLAETELAAAGHFRISAPKLEEQSWQAGRLVIRVQDKHGRQAEGFVSVASFNDITRRAGIVGRRLFALLAGTETPADVAAIMSWFCEDPKRLADAAPDSFGGGGKDPNGAEKPAPTILVADLSGTYAEMLAAATAAGHDKGTTGSWSRFMDHIFAAFREKRGPFGGASAEGKGEDDDDATDGSESAPVEDPAIAKSLFVFERLFDLLLQPEKVARHAIMAFDLSEYVCERLQPDAAQARDWLERLVNALPNADVPPERRGDVAAAVLTLAGLSNEHTGPRWARGCLLRLKVDLSGDVPSTDGVKGFQSVLPPSKGLAELWPQIQGIRTFPEQVRSYLRALEDGNSSGDFGDLASAAKEEWPVLSDALKSKEPFKKFLKLDKLRDYCPRCNIGLPTGEQNKLKSVGIATTKNCCSRVLVWTGG